MKPEKIRAILKDKISEITELSEQVGKDFDVDIIHDFRVAVKVLRSFLRLLRTHHQEPGLKMTKKFKRLYQTAGAIRDAQLELEKLSGNDLPLPSYIAMLHSAIDRQKQEWYKIYSKKVLKKLEVRLLDYPYEPIPPEALADFFAAQMASIHNIGAGKSPTDDQVHSVRKRAKDILYTNILAKKRWKAAYKKLEDRPVKQLDNLTDIIGDYNDERITLAHLSSFSSKKMGLGEENAINDICEEEAALLMEQKIEILELVKNLVAGNSK